jgi:chromate transporter
VFARFLRLGLTSFGGPVAHLGFFRREFVDAAGWLTDAEFGEIVALCSVLPGPTSSQVGMLLGALRAGPIGGCLAWLAFTAPSAAALTAFGLAMRAAGSAGERPLWAAGALEGLGAAAAAVVLLAVVSMARSLAATVPTGLIAAGSFALSLALNRIAPPLAWTPLALGAAAGAAALRNGVTLPPAAFPLRAARSAGWTAFALLVAGLAALPAAAAVSPPLAVFSTFFRAGALVFGGGHVVLPFLEGLVRSGDVSAEAFIAGYGAAQAVPGPLFTFAAYLGAISRVAPAGIPGALIAIAAIFLPSPLILCAALPLWRSLRTLPRASQALAGVNASVVGLLAAVFVDPVARGALVSPLAVGLAAASFAALSVAKIPAWAVVASSAIAGAALSFPLANLKLPWGQ